MTDLVSDEARLTSTIREDWQTGSVVDVTLSALEPVNGWQVELDAGGTIVNIWNAVVLSNEGTRYRVGAVDYNHLVRAGTAVQFGMEIDGGGPFALLGAEIELAADVADASAEAGVPAPPPVAGGPVPTPGTPPAATAAETPAPAPEPAPEPAQPGPPAVAIAVSGPTVVEPAGEAVDLAAFPPGAFSVRGTAIVDAAGEPVEINGINWFGFETDIFVAHGLWARNWRGMMDEVKSLGFNTLRIPFSGELAATGGTVSGVDFGYNPDLAGLDGLEILDAIVDYADTIGLRVILDYHRGNPGGGPNDNGLWYGDGRTEADVIAEWRTMAARYADKPAVIGADLINEPHMATWGDGSATDWAAAAARIGNAVQQIAPQWLIIVEGTSVYDGDGYWWGGNLQGVRDHPVALNDPAKLVYSIHDYPPSVYDQPWFNDGRSLPEVWDKNWGYIVKDGIGPVLIGEWGSFLATHQDLAWAEELSAYIADLGLPWFWWSLNPNSGDTGGLFADDWTTVRPEVARLLEPFLGETQPPVALDASASPVTADFVVSLDRPAPNDMLVKYATTDGTATAGEDYVATAGTLTFTTGEREKTVSVPILPDMDTEGDTFFYLVLGGGSGSRASGTGVITEDERGTARRPAAMPMLDVANTVFAEGAEAASFRLVLSAPAAEDVAIDFTLTGADGSRTAHSAVIPAGARQVDLEVPIEPGVQRFTLELTAADGAAIRNGGAEAQLAGDGPLGSVTGEAATAQTQLTIELILEEDWGSGSLFNVILKNVSDHPVEAWTLAMDLPFDISEIWSAAVVADEGERVTLENAQWNGEIGPGETINFGFIATAGGIALDQLVGAADFALTVQ
ncbi:cellulase family glycosylhydrolase [Acuticoccus sp. I52.16.1]|uniref:cellulase family glycosylhydrolase n=1 Tax=Acuticoccus sp. I52.16.1 TaxID=2928472 RepID=UPI001FD3B3E5|nr:cellulase family glycosylhydrolase [Acuticoccus sp. I52.16.1]UOM35207.1 cellulase family glycosylhydrolase [Acuticoccus sp. I52.16.1]